MPGFVLHDAIETDVPYPDEDDEDGEEAYYEALDAAHMAQQQRLIDAFHTAEGLLDLPYGTLPVPSALLGDDFDATSTDLEKAIHDEFGCLEHPDHGGFIGNAIVSAVVQALGFDAIILLDANTRFRSMDMHPNTAHLHVFEHRDDNLRVLTVCAADRQETALAA